MKFVCFEKLNFVIYIEERKTFIGTQNNNNNLHFVAKNCEMIHVKTPRRIPAIFTNFKQVETKRILFASSQLIGGNRTLAVEQRF